VGFMDKLNQAKDKLLREHGDKVEEGVDKAADFVDEKTGGKYSDQIDSGADKAKEHIQQYGQDQ